jgi:hypothetical protein
LGRAAGSTDGDEIHAKAVAQLKLYGGAADQRRPRHHHGFNDADVRRTRAFEGSHDLQPGFFG